MNISPPSFNDPQNRAFREAMKRITIARDKNLTSLDLSGLGLTMIPSQVFELSHLVTLDLRQTQLTVVPESITRLTNLRTLDLTSNHLTEVPESITRLTNLKELSLGGNRLTMVPESITRLVNLMTLYLTSNRFTMVPESITRLTNLRTLYLGGNPLMMVQESITRLTNLTTLSLSNNRLTEVPESITRLTNLTELGLWSNYLKTVPESITRLTNLKELNLRGNHLTEVPESITRLTNLKELNLTNNQLTAIPESITRLVNLRTLYLTSNRFTMVPESITRLLNLLFLHLDGNPIETPPPEVAFKGIEAIRDYYRQIKTAGEDHLFEAKLLIVGEAGAGKTSLAKKILDAKYVLEPGEKSTEGIQVTNWEFPIENGNTFRVNIWDFGGQEIYHATHQFFLTQRSLYVLVADERAENTDFYYWLSVVGLLSGNSPLLIVKNEKQDRKRELNERQLKGQYDDLKDVLSTNLDTNRGLEQVVREIKHYLQTLPHIGTPLPRTWVKVREKLEQDPRNHIPVEEFLEICQQNGFTRKEDKLQLSGYLHDLGVILHFQQDDLLYRTVILKPKWGTDAVYMALDNKQVLAKHGRFTRGDLNRIWSAPEYEEMQPELLQLMVNFKLCYMIPGTELYIAPQLLGDNLPEYDWDGSDNLTLRYSYEFMPKGIISQFIVVMHKLVEGQELVWKSGVVIERDGTRAEVIEYYGKRELRVRVSGAYKKDLLTIVMYELDKIHDSYSKLEYSKLIPCNCSTCKELQEPHYYPFQVLQNFLRDRQQVIQCQKKPYQMVNVQQLIDDVIEFGTLARAEGDKAAVVYKYYGPVYQQSGGVSISGGDVDVKGDMLAGDKI